jgi:uncharacterized protein (DUF2336 family)
MQVRGKLSAHTMQPHHSLIAELDQVASDASGARREQVLADVVELFLGAKRYDDDQIELFDQVMGRLIERIEAGALAQLSERLAPVGYAPPRVVRTLAMNADIAVAGPVLARSTRLSETDLIAVANSKSQAHLLAICCRGRLGEPVTDVLVVRGNPEVARSVVANPGAIFSKAGFDELARRAEADEELAVHLARRPELPLRLFCALLASAADVVKERLLAATRRENHVRVEQVVDKVSGRIADETTQDRNYAAALRAVLSLSRAGKLTEDYIVHLAANKRCEEIVAALSLIWSVPLEAAEQILCRAPMEALLCACKAAGFAWPTVRAIIQAGPRAPSPGRLIELRADFAEITAAAAKNSLAPWQTAPPGLAS